ncbi:MAG: response regulator transcription factor [Gloeobacteraceae cyanobacterium ES-bin-144]|nr:response regulator transcription factor [Verrucomicrobiales bacterium]
MVKKAQVLPLTPNAAPAAKLDESKTKALRIPVVDDHPVIRKGLVQILAEEFTDMVAGEASDAAQALEEIWKHEWDVVILDITMPGRSGLDVLKEVRQFAPKLPVLILSVHTEDQFAVRVLRSGAAGYLTKHVASTELVAAVKRVLTGAKYIRPSVAERLAEHVESGTNNPLHQSLSNREFQVLRLIALGKTIKEIGGELSLSVKTISTYRCRILTKMKLKNNAEIMRHALQHDLVSFDRPEPNRGD